MLINDAGAAVRLASGRPRPSGGLQAADDAGPGPVRARPTRPGPGDHDGGVAGSSTRRRAALLRRRRRRPGALGRAVAAAGLRPCWTICVAELPDAYDRRPGRDARPSSRLFTGGSVGGDRRWPNGAGAARPRPPAPDPRPDRADRGPGLRRPRARRPCTPAQQLLDALTATRVSATRAGLAYALIAVTGVFFGAEYQLPRSVGPLGPLARGPGTAGRTPGRAGRGRAARPGRWSRAARLAAAGRGPAAPPRRPGGCGGAAARGVRPAAGG